MKDSIPDTQQVLHRFVKVANAHRGRPVAASRRPLEVGALPRLTAGETEARRPPTRPRAQSRSAARLGLAPEPAQFSVPGSRDATGRAWTSRAPRAGAGPALL